MTDQDATTITADQYRALLAAENEPRRNKYGARPLVVAGERFDSTSEYTRWRELQLLQRAGQISNLQRQVRYRFVVNEVEIGAYVADFTYIEGGRLVVEDRKGGQATRTAAYRIKKRLMRALYGVEIRETSA